MRIAGLFDIHGNLPALAAVLEGLANERVDVVVVGGDTAWGPLSGECIDLLAALPYELHWLMGNCDREVLAASDGVAGASEMATFTAERLTDQQLAVLRESNATVRLEDGEGRELLFCHGSPRADTDFVTRDSPGSRVLPMLEGSTGVVVGGHTHQQFDRVFDDRRFVNAGSVGLPYEGRRAAYWLLIGEDFQMRETLYDVDSAINALRATGFPLFDEVFGDSLITPIAPEKATKGLEEQAVSGESS